MNTETKLREICGKFRVSGTFAGYEHIKVGNVNQTYMVVFRDRRGKRTRYCLQRINSYAFRNPQKLMYNVENITEHIAAKDPAHQGIKYLHAEDGASYVKDKEDIWRMYTYIPGTTFNQADNMSIVQEAGRAFGDFQMYLSDFDANSLHETIPDFHNTPKRLNNLYASVDRDLVGRVESVMDEIEGIRSMEKEAVLLQELRDSGDLPVRVTHNDTKLNNVLFNEQTMTATTVIDLDTVMPGLIAYDFGDAIRFMANTEAEDSPNWQDVSIDLEIFRTFTRGFLSRLEGVLTPLEVKTLSYGPFVLALELASRFLDDYILGDLYFKTEYPEHNLDRTRCQLQLARVFLENREVMQEIIESCLTKND